MDNLYKRKKRVSIRLILVFGLLHLFVSSSWDSAITTAIASDVKPKKGANVYQMVTGDDFEEDQRHWNKFYDTKTYVFGKEPSSFLLDSIPYLPTGRGSNGLDLAMGEGRNTVFLAKKGFRMEGVDISEVALRKAKRLARENKVPLTTILADLADYSVKPDTYQVILNINFLQRSLIPHMKRGLKRGGVIVFENFTVDQLKRLDDENLPHDCLLARNELKELFKDFEILIYREFDNGKEAKAQMVARKP